jgi:hypothetical protein
MKDTKDMESPKNIKDVARTMTVTQLIHVNKVLNAELESAMLAGTRGTQAHIGMLEMAQACADELDARGYLHGRKADGSDLPRDISWIDGVKLSNAIRCF